MQNATELKQALSGFHGTEKWHRWSILAPKCLLTDGAKYLADHAGAYWLMDIIASWQRRLIQNEEYFQVWQIKTTDGSAVLTCSDGNYNQLVHQDIPSTDFPLVSCKLYASFDFDGDYTIIFLPTEY